MRIANAVVLALLGVVMTGCRNDPTISYLEADNRTKEMEIYHLKGRVEDLEEQLNAAAAPQQGFTRPGTAGATSPPPGRLETAPTFSRPGPALLPPSNAPAEPAAPGIGPLNISPGIETPSGDIPNTLRAPAGKEPGRISPPGGASIWRPSDVRLVRGTATVENQNVAQITLHPSLTGGIGSGMAGDEGLLVVVEPRDFAGKIVPVAADTKVALIDPALSGEEARLARWDFSAAQTERMLHTGSEPGIHLRLKWRFPPSHDRLTVVVRYATRDGKWLEARQVIAVATGESTSRPEFAERHPDPRDQRQPSDPPPAAPQRPQWSPVRD
jgi:hypothetical protein